MMYQLRVRHAPEHIALNLGQHQPDSEIYGQTYP